MGTNHHPNKSTAQALDQKAIQGVDKYFAKVKTMTIAGTDYSPADLKDVFQGEIDAIAAFDTLHAQYQQQAADTRAARAKAIDARAGLRAFVLATKGAAAVQMLGDFGMTVPNPLGKRTAQAKADAVAKALDTRKARKPVTKVTTSATSTAAQAETPAQVAQATSPAQVVQATVPAQVVAPAAASDAQSN